MTLLYATAAVALYLYAFWLLYILVMGLYRAHLAGRLGPLATALALPAVALAYLVDLLANWTIAAAIFRELPRRPLELVTDRLSRYLAHQDCSSSYRRRWAVWLCTTLLDPLDPTGQHCR